MYVRLILFAFSISEVSSARILCVYPSASISHQIVFRALTNELAKRGHELVVVTPNPEFSKERPPDNITEIDSSSMYMYKKLLESMADWKRLRGVVVTPERLMTPDNYKVILYSVIEVFKNQEFKSLLEDKTQKFELIIAESLFSMPAVLTKFFDAPMIWISSFLGQTNNYEAFGAPTRHPLLYPIYFRNRFLNLNLWEKIYQIYVEINYWRTFNAMEELQNEALKEIFGDTIPSVHYLKNNIELFFVNANPIFEGNRPVPPNIIYLGGVHMKPVKRLPIDLKSYLDDSKIGVVYVSLGTNVQPSTMDPILLDVFLKAFEALPFNILWKFDGDDVPDIPQNVRVQKWFPQRDLLSHPNIKAFITQGGMQSTDEAIYSGVPLVGIPALGDQWFNVEQYQRLGIGVKLDMLTLKVDDIVNAVNTVVMDKRYQENAIKLGQLIRDQPETPLERAVWWTEYVIRHKGAKHLRSPAAGISWSEYFMLDVVASVLSLIILVTVVLAHILKYVFHFLCLNKKKIKKN